MSETVEPALSPEQWATFVERKDDPAWKPSVFTSAHAAATMALYDQPFGFTREDVDALTRLADSCEQQRAASVRSWNEESALRQMAGTALLTLQQSNQELHHRALHFRSLAARIRALLPPTPTETPK